jgi:1-acyl-sn-glycerol-3-phosphate acyltransferase
MAKPRKKTSKKFIALLKSLLGPYLTHKFSLSIENPEVVRLKPPYVLLANHTNFWDPFLLSLYIPEPVYYVASDEYFRNPLLRNLLRLVGAIPKSKFVSDTASVMDILRVKRNGGVIGIFPEGRRNWDGCTSELIFSTSKLIKSLKIPVITAVLQGAHLSFPRWAKMSRKGRIVIKYEAVLSPDEIPAMSAEEIHRAISESLTYSDYDFQNINHISFEGKKLAENLELYLFICPGCHALCSLVSAGDTIYCGNCGYSAKYEKEGFLTVTKGETCFKTPGEWNSWQEAYLKGFIRSREGANNERTIFEDHNVTVKRGKRLIPLKKINFGHMGLFNDRIEFTSLLKQRTIFYIDRIIGLNVQYRNQFEFYYDGLLYRFSFRYTAVSAYKWVLAVRLIKELHGDLILTD